MLGLVDHGRVVVVAMRRHGVTVPRNAIPITFPRSPIEEPTPVHHSLCVVIIVTTFTIYNHLVRNHVLLLRLRSSASRR